MANMSDRVVGSEAAGIPRRVCEGDVGIVVRASLDLLRFAAPGVSHRISGNPFAAWAQPFFFRNLANSRHSGSSRPQVTAKFSDTHAPAAGNGDRSRIADLRRTSIYPPAAFGKNWEPQLPGQERPFQPDSCRVSEGFTRSGPGTRASGQEETFEPRRDRLSDTLQVCVSQRVLPAVLTIHVNCKALHPELADGLEPETRFVDRDNRRALHRMA